MQRLILSLLFISGITAIYAQSSSETEVTPPDQEKIRIAVLSNSSEFYYPNLYGRYDEGDTTLNLEDYRHLYYGYVYQDYYRPLESLNYADSIIVALSMNKSDSVISPEIFDMLFRYTEKALRAEPFNMNYLNYRAYIEAQSGDIEEARKNAYKVRMIKETIFSSGTGLTDKSPWHVLYRSDEQDIMNSLGVRFSKPIRVLSDVEYFHLPIRNNGNRGYYFDISRLFLRRPETSYDKQKRKFEFNPYDNPRSSRHIKYKSY